MAHITTTRSRAVEEEVPFFQSFPTLKTIFSFLSKSSDLFCLMSPLPRKGTCMGLAPGTVCDKAEGPPQPPAPAGMPAPYPG